MQAQRKRLWLIGMILIYIAIAIGGFLIAYVVKTYFLSSQSSNVPSPKVSNVKPIKTPAGWNTYTNQALKLKFSYPSSDHIKASSYGFGVSSVTLQDSDGNEDFQILLLPKSLAQAVGQNFDGYYAMSDYTTKVIKSPIAQDNATEKFTKIRNRTVNGLEALDYQSVPSNAPANSTPEIGTFILAGNNLVLISTDADNKTKLEELLSSFMYSP